MKDFKAPRHNPYMTIEERLKRADPARGQDQLDNDLIFRAAQTAAAKADRSTRQGNAWQAKTRRTALTLGAFSASVAIVAAVAIVAPGVLGQWQTTSRTEFFASKGLPESAEPKNSDRESSAIAAATYGSAEGLAANSNTSLPALSTPIRYAPYGQYDSPIYNSWWNALGVPHVFAGVALINKSVAFVPSRSLLRRKITMGTIYRVFPNTTATSAALSLSKLFGITEPLHTSRAGSYGLQTITAGNVPLTATLSFGIGQDYPASAYRGLALIGSKNGIRWVYGDSSATAWRDCQPGDSMKKNVSIISRGETKSKKKCRALPSGLGPNRTLAVDRAKLLFQNLGYKTGNTESSTPNGGLFVVASGFDESQDGRATYFQGTVSGYLKVAGQVTTLAQKVVFSSSSQQIVSAEGFIGNAAPVNTTRLKAPAAAARQISVYDLDPVNSINLFNPKNVGYDYPRNDLSTSILNAPAGDASNPRANPKRIVVTGLKIFPGVISAYDGSTWLIPSYAFSDRGGYLGSVKALLSSKVKLYTPKAMQ